MAPFTASMAWVPSTVMKFEEVVITYTLDDVSVMYDLLTHIDGTLHEL